MTRNSINVEITSCGYFITCLGGDGFKAAQLWNALELGMKWANKVLASHI